MNNNQPKESNTSYRWVSGFDRKPPEGYTGIIKVVNLDGSYHIYDCQIKWQSLTHHLNEDPLKNTTYWLEEIELPSIRTVDYEKEAEILYPFDKFAHPALTANTRKLRAAFVKGCQVQAAREKGAFNVLKNIYEQINDSFPRTWTPTEMIEWVKEVSLQIIEFEPTEETKPVVADPRTYAKRWAKSELGGAFTNKEDKPIVSAEENASEFMQRTGMLNLNGHLLKQFSPSELAKSMEEYANQFKGNPSIKQISDAWEEKAEELWDQYATYIDDNSDSFQQVAGSSVITRKYFLEAFKKFVSSKNI